MQSDCIVCQVSYLPWEARKQLFSTKNPKPISQIQHLSHRFLHLNWPRPYKVKFIYIVFSWKEQYVIIMACDLSQLVYKGYAEIKGKFLNKRKIPILFGKYLLNFI